MTDTLNRCREEFEAFVYRASDQSEGLLEKDSRGNYLNNVAVGGWPALGGYRRTCGTHISKQ